VPGGNLRVVSYVVPPDYLPAYPDARRARAKTRLVDGGLRARWKDDEGKIYEWDYQHGKVEIYTKNGRKHLGEFDPLDGRQTGPADPRRRVEP